MIRCAPVRWSFLVLLAFPAAASPIVQERVWSLEAEAVVTGAGQPGTVGHAAARIAGESPGTFEIGIPAAAGAPAAILRATASLVSWTEDGALLDLEVRVTPEGGGSLVATRRVAVREEGQQILDVYGDPRRHVLLALSGERTSRPAVRRLASPGAPVRFRLAIERVNGDQSVPLETNDLDTFVGEPVEYSFDLGPGSGDQKLRLVLTPIRLADDVIEFRAEMSGQLPGESGPLLLSRDQDVVASRGGTTILAALAGIPPSGYRFHIVPEF